MQEKIDFDLDKIVIKSNKLSEAYHALCMDNYGINSGVYGVNKKCDPYRANDILNKGIYKANKFYWEFD